MTAARSLPEFRHMRALALAASPRRPRARAAAAPLPLLRATMASSADAAGSSGARIIDGTALAK